MKSDKAKSVPANSDNRVQGFVFGINLEGSEQVVMEGIKAFTSAMTKSGGILTAPIARPILPSSPTSKQKSSAGAPVADQPDTSEETPEEQIEVDGQEEVEEPSDEAPPNGTGPKRDYIFKAPNFLHDLDLRTADKPLSDFMAEKGNPTETMDRYIVIAVWFKDHMNTAEFKIDHIWTAYNALGWKAQFPANHSQPLRDLKKKKFVTKEKGSDYKVGWLGEQHVAGLNADTA